MTLALLAIMVAATVAVLVAFNLVARRLDPVERHAPARSGGRPSPWSDDAARERPPFRLHPGTALPPSHHGFPWHVPDHLPADFDQRTGHTSATSERAEAAQPGAGADLPCLRARSRLVFAESDQSGITLDCTLVELEGDPLGAVPTGAPFTLQLRTPDTGWFSACVENLLEQWAEEARLVDLQIEASQEEGLPRAKLTDGASRVMLELETAAGLTQS